MTPQTPEQIAGRLTKAQRRAVLAMSCEWLTALRLNTSGKSMGGMVALGIAERADSRFTARIYRLTPLGTQVRAILRGEEP